MSHLSCCLCSATISIAEFDLQKTFTSYSKTSLLSLLRSCIAGEFLIDSYLICKMCYLLLNELDSIKIRAQSIEEKLKNYVCKYANDRIQEAVETSKEEECTLCLKKVNTKNLKSHLKTYHADLNDIETSIDFDEVNSISEISPSLEDLNLLEETGEKNNIKLEPSEADSKKNIYSITKTKSNGSNNVKPYSCSECSKTWKTFAELKNHMSAHSNERPYICEICGQAYKRRQALTIHVGMHKGINPFTCVYCKKSFTQKGALVRHTPIHTGELPFQCDLCGKRFVHHTSFNIHKLSHTGEKSYKCDVCGLLLISGSHLKRHMRVHTGEKRFSCSSCGKKFAEKYNLAVHEKLHLGVSKKKKYQCHICDNLYSGQVKLEEHLLNVHQKAQYPRDPLELP